MHSSTSAKNCHDVLARELARIETERHESIGEQSRPPFLDGSFDSFISARLVDRSETVGGCSKPESTGRPLTQS